MSKGLTYLWFLFFIHSHFLEFLTTIARIQRNGIFQLPFFPVAEEAIVPWKAAPKKRKTMYLRKRKRISFVNFCPLSVTSCSLKEIQMNKFYIYWFSLLFWSNMVCSLLTITAHVLFKANFAAVWRNISRVPPPLSHTLETTSTCSFYFLFISISFLWRSDCTHLELSL